MTARDPKLLTPGPVSTAPAVRAAMARDYAPWDPPFRALVARVRARLLTLSGGTAETHAAMLVPGCGHYAIEAALRTVVPASRTLLVPMTGAYAERLCRLARAIGLRVLEMPVPVSKRIDPAALSRALTADPAISHVGLIYSETATGIVHDVATLGAVARVAGARTIVDAVSAFGALPLDVSRMPEADALVATANKCLEGTPGLGIVVARIDRLAAPEGVRGSWSFDLGDAYAHGLRAGQGAFPFTPPAQTIAALDVALNLLDIEGPAARAARYAANAAILYDGIAGLGLAPVLARAVQGPIVVNINAPADPAWDLERFVNLMREQHFVVSNFYNTEQPSFRIGCIGDLHAADMHAAVQAIGRSLALMGIAARKAA